MEDKVYIVIEEDNEGINDFMTNVMGAYSTEDRALKAIDRRREWWISEGGAEFHGYPCCKSPTKDCVGRWFQYMIAEDTLDTYDMPTDQQEIE